MGGAVRMGRWLTSEVRWDQSHLIPLSSQQAPKSYFAEKCPSCLDSGAELFRVLLHVQYRSLAVSYQDIIYKNSKVSEFTVYFLLFTEASFSNLFSVSSVENLSNGCHCVCLSLLPWGDHRGLVLENRAETSQEGCCGRQPGEMSAQSHFGWEKTNSRHGEIRVAQPIVSH